MLTVPHVFAIQFLSETAGALSGFQRMSLALGGIATTAVSSGMALEDAMVEVGTAIEFVGLTMAGTQLSVDEMVKSIHNLNLSAAEFLPVAARWAKAGVGIKDGLIEMTQFTRDMSFATGKNADSVADSMADIQTSMQLTTEETKHLGSMFIFLENRTDVSTETLDMLYKRVGGLWQEMDLGIPTLAAVAIGLDQHGLKAKQATGVLQSLADQFSDMNGRGMRLATIFQMAGGSIEEFQQMSRPNQIKAFIEAIGKLPKTDADFALKQIGMGGAAASMALRQLGRDSELLEKTFKMSNEGIADMSGLESEVAAKSASLSGKLDLLWQEVKALWEETGKELTPIMGEFVDVLRDVVHWARSLSPEFRALIVGIGGAVPVIYGVVKVFSALKAIGLSLEIANVASSLSKLTFPLKLIEAFSGLKALALSGLTPIIEAFSFLGTLALSALAPLVAWLPVIALVGAAIYLIYTRWDGMVAGIKALGEILGEFLGSVWEGIKTGAVMAWDAITAVVSMAFYVMTLPFRVLWVEVSTLFTFMWDMAKVVGGGISDAFTYAFGLVSDAVNYVSSLISDLWEAIKSGAEAVVAPLKEVWNWFESLGESADAVWTSLFGSGLFHISEGAGDAVKGLGQISSALGGVHDEAGKAMSNLKGMLSPIEVPTAAASTGVVPPRHSLEPIPVAITKTPLVQKQNDPAGIMREVQEVLQDILSSLRSPTDTTRGNAEVMVRIADIPVKVTVPVSVQLDGFILARAVSEQLVEIRQERFFNEPSHPMRGVEK